MSPSQSERREYFRIKNWIVINHTPIEAIENEPPIEEVSRVSSPKIKLLQSLAELEAENSKVLSSLDDKNSDFATYLQILNTKLAELSNIAVDSLQTDTKNLTEVDISGGGLRFTSEQTYSIDQLLKIEIILVPECVGVAAYARVVDVQENSQGKGHEIALIFVKLMEADRDAIIKHVFQVQSKQLRENKKADS